MFKSFYLSLAFLFLLPALSHAQGTSPLYSAQISRTQDNSGTEKALDAEPINVACSAGFELLADPGCASFTINARGLKKVTLIIKFTKSTATKVFMEVDGSTTNAATGPWGIQQGGTASLPAMVMTNLTPEWDTTSATVEVWQVIYTVEAPDMRFRFWSTGGAAGDIIDVYTVQAGL
ncbi:MAG: hypothetical protein JRD89_01405 [Deltaproteobacteria bacterium]|nr:hypothetical protein [Deltaproteobacteria bacterium]